MGYEGFLAFWFNSWLALIGLVVSIVLTLLVVSRENWRGPGPIVVAIMALTIFACLPLALSRMGMILEVGDPESLGYVNVAGTIAAIVLGGGRLLLQVGYGGTRGAADTSDGFPQQTEYGTMDGTLMNDADAPGTFAGEQGTLTAMAAGASPAADDATLLVASGPRAGQSIPLQGATINLGRAVDNDVVFDDSTVSRHHATISYRDGNYYIEDAGSMGGTLVDGTPTSGSVLSPGATFRIGETEVVFVRADSDNPLLGTRSGTGSAPPPSAAPPSAAPGETMVMQREWAPTMAWLAVTAGPSRGRSHQLREGNNTIGRASDNDLAIEDRAISRHHAMVRVEEGRITLVDLGSSGGIRVGERSIGGRSIQPGGTITVGRTRLALVSVEPGNDIPQGTMSGQTIVDSAPRGSAVLIAQAGPDSGKSFLVSEGDNVIGRDTGCQILLSDEAVSRTHAMVRLDGGSFAVFDSGSRSGTAVGEHRIGGHELRGGEKISLGQSEVVLMQPAS